MTECPLCQRTFSTAAIEAHAATCEGAKEKVETGRDAFSVLMDGGHRKKPKVQQKQAVQATVAEEEEEVIALDASNEPIIQSAGVQKNTASAFDRLMSNSKRKESNTATKVETVVHENDDAKDIETETTSKKSYSGSSAFQMLMAASAELSRPQCLIFDFDSGVCTYSDTIPETSPGEWRGTVKLGKGPSQTKVSLIGLHVDADQVQDVLPCSPSSRLTVGTLKSVMQKAYRRRESLTVVRAASELASKSWTDLVRRVPIVVLEDSIADWCYAGLVWIMLADAGGLKPSPKLVRFILSALEIGAKSKVQDSCELFEPNSPSRSEVSALEPEDAALIFAIRARSLFGGMPVDVDMCKRFARGWFERLKGGSSQANLFRSQWLKKPVIHEHHFPLKGFPPTPVPFPPLASVDSHCQPMLFVPLAAKYGVSMDDIRSAMWHFRGSLNFRRSAGHCSEWELSDDDMEMVKQEVLKREQLKFSPRDSAEAGLMAVWNVVGGECDRISKQFLVEMLASSS